jgi:ABC-type cobalamin transport system permease subunit
MTRPRLSAYGLAPALVVALAVHAVATTDDGTTTPIVVRVEHGGFRFVDAAIGAIAVVGALLVTAAAVTLVRLRRSESRSRSRGDRP